MILDPSFHTEGSYRYYNRLLQKVQTLTDAPDALRVLTVEQN